MGPALTLQLTTDASVPVTGRFTVTFSFNQEVLHRPSMSGETAQYPRSQEFLAEDVEVTPGMVSVGAQVLTDDETVFTVSVDPPADFEGTLTVRVPALAAWNANGAANQEESLLDVQVDTLAPALIGAAVADTTLALRYSEALDEESAPAPDAFTMIPSRTVSGVAVRGDTVTLTLAAAVPPGEPVTLTYAVPDTDPIRDVAGNAAAALSDREVAAGPAIDLVEITSDAGTDDTYAIGDVIEATVTLSEAVTVSGAPYLELDFGGQEARRADYAAGASTATALVFTYPVAVGDAAADGVAIGANRLQRNGGVIRNGLDVDAVLIHAEVAADPAHKVDGVGPTLTVAATTRDGAAIVLTFNEPLAAATAGAGAFTVSVDGIAGTVNRVSVNGSELTLALAAAVTASETATVSYADPTPGDDAHAVQDAFGNDAADLHAVPVVNYVRPWVTAIERTVSQFGPFTDEFVLTQRKFELAIAFNQVVTGFDAGDLVVVNGTITEFSPCHSAIAYCVVIQPMVPMGEDQATVTVKVPDDVVDGGNWGTVPYLHDDAKKPGFPSASARPGRATQWAGLLQVGSAPTLQLTSTAATPVTDTFTVTFSFDQPVLHRDAGESAIYPVEEYFDAHDVALTWSTGTGMPSGAFVTLDNTVFTVNVDPPADFEGTLTVGVPALAAWNANGAANQEESLLVVQVDTLAPALIVAAVTDTTLALRYSEPLDEASAPAPGAFTVTPARTVTGVAVADDTVTLTLAAAVTPGDAVTLSYAVPGTDPLRDLAGNAAAALTGRHVATGPTIERVEITSDPGTDDTYAIGDAIKATVTLSEAVTVTVGGTPYLELDLGGHLKRAAYAGGESTATALVFAYPVAAGDADADGVAIGANKLQLNGNTIRNGSDVDATLTHVGVAADPGHQVDGVRPTLTWAATATDGAAIVLTFSEPLAAATAGASAFAVSVDGTARTVNSVSVKGSELTLALAAAVTAGDTVTVSYTYPTPGDDQAAVQDLAGNDAAGFSEQTVTNNAPDPPTSLTATANGQTQIDLSWTAPADDGGSAITGYKIEWSADGTTNWADLVADTGSDAVTYVDAMLAAGTTRHYRVSAINPVGAGAASSVASTTTDVPVTVTVAEELSVLENDATAEIAVTATTGIDAPPPRPFAVQLATADGTATAHEDYLPLTLTVGFAVDDFSAEEIDGVSRWQATQFLHVPISLPDAIIEADETFTMTLSRPEGLSPAIVLGTANTLTVTILNDDGIDATLSGLAVNDGTNDLTLTPTFATDTTSYAASVGNDIDRITVTPETNDDGATVAYLDENDAEITDADDMTEDQQVDLLVGANTIKVQVTAADEMTTQTYTLTVTRAAQLSVVSIAADTTRTTLDIGTASFTLTRTGATTDALTVDVEVTEEFTYLIGPLPTTATFAANESEAKLEFNRLSGIGTSETGDLTVTIQDGTDYEVSATAASAAIKVVVLDPVMTFRLDAAEKAVAEDVDSFTVTVTAETAEGATKPQATRGMDVVISSTLGTATVGDDFESFSTYLEFAPDDFTLSGTVYRAEKTQTITIVDDDLFEPPVDGNEESFTVVLERTPVTRTRIAIPDTTDAPGAMVVTIEDDDKPDWTLTVEPDTIAEADASSSTVTVSTGGVTFADDQTIALDFTDSTADIGNDYTVADKELTLTAGQTSVTTSITAVNDAVDDDDETILVTAMLDDAQIGDRQTITITDDDAAAAMLNTSLTPSPADPVVATRSSAMYTVEFEGAWTTTATPGGLPAGAHFSPLIGGVHNDQVTFLTDGGMASAGVESMAEVGGTSTLSGEVEADANALHVLHRSGNINPTASATLNATLDTDHPRVTLLTMIAPSPDWFVGVSGLSLLDASGNWVASHTVDLYAWDAGTEDGAEFSLANPATSPQGVITNLRGTGKFSNEKIATLTFTRGTVTVTPEVSIAADAGQTTIELGVASYTLTRTGSTAEPLTVTVSVVPNDIVISSSLPTTVTFDSGESEANLVLDDWDDDATTTGDLSVTVHEGEGYDVSATAATATVEVLVFETVLTFRLDAAAKNVGEWDGSVSAMVIAETAAGATAPAVTGLEVSVSTEADTAEFDTDYTGLTEIVSFAPSDFNLTGDVYRAEKTLSVVILDDVLFEPAVDGVEEQFEIGLDPTPGSARFRRATIPDTEEAPATMVVTIVDNDKPTWELAVEPDTIAEADASSSTVTVSTGGVTFADDQTIALDFTDSTADIGNDYTVADKELTLTAGQTSVTTSITAVNDAVDDDDETILVTAMLDDAQIGVQQTITITDDDAPNNAPVFDESSPAARSVAENTAAEQDIGAAVSATDADDDTLTYTLEGTDAASFDIVSGTGQIQTKAALDYETKSSYSVTVKADDGQGGSATIAVTISITDVLEAPGAPTGLMAAAMGETQIVLSWTAPTDDGGADITGYRIEWSEDDDGPWTVLVEDTGSTSTSYTDTVTPGTIRWYRVFAINSVGAGAVSPTPVRGVSGGALTVAWASNNPPAEHRGGTGVDLLIEFSEDISGSASDRKTAGAVVTNAAVLQFKRTETGQNTRFTIRLTATDPAAPVTFTLPANRPCTETGAICTSGGKRLSNELEATLQPPRPPGMPTGLQGTADGETAIDLEWTAPADIGSGNITGYRIEWSADGSTNWADLVADTGNTDTTYADEGLDPGTTRHYRVSAINRAGPGDPSVSIEASALSPLTAAFENLPASHGGDGATFTFNVRFSEDIETNTAGMRDNGITVTNGSLTRTRRVSGQKDYWVFDISPASTAAVTIAFEVPEHCAVLANICTIDNRPLSEKLEGTVVYQVGAPGVPGSLTADAKATEIVLSWDAPLSTGGSAITGYRIELSTDAGVNWTELVASQTARSYTHGSLMAGDTRHYRVSAINANGTGTPTTPASATAGTLTASFTQIPATHDGSTAFAAQIQFSEAVGISADDFRDHAVTASGGSVTGATMVADDLFEITVAPTGASDVVLSLDADQPCSEDGAICGKDTKRRLSQALEATVLGLPVVGITGDAEPVVEGGTVTFTLKRSGSAADTLTVNLNVNLQGEFGLTGGTRTFAFANTETSGTLTFATTNDDDHEPDGSVEVVVQSGSGYVVDPDNNASLVAIEDNDGDATLSGLSLSRAGTNFPVSPPFSADTITYTASVPNDVTAFKITATANDSNATVDITPADARPGAGHQVEPEVGDNTITITVTAGVTTRAYTVTVTRLAPPTVTIAAVTSPVIEDAATGVAFTLNRTGDLSAGLTVTVRVTESESMMCSTALGDQQVQFGANEADKVLGADVLDICESQSFDTDSVVTAAIVEDDDYQIGDPGEAMVTVEDSGLEVQVAVSVSATNPAEDAGDITVTVRARTDQARCWFENFSIRVIDSATGGLVAVPDKDYSFTDETVRFRKGTATNAARCKLVETSSGTTVGRQEWTGTLSISEDVVVEGDEQFKVLLFEGGLPEAVTVTTGERIVTIKDNDEPTWDVSVSDTSVAEAGGTSVVTVSTGGVTFPDDQTITLGLTGTATATDDYTITAAGTTLTAPYEITLAADETSVTATITAVNDAVDDDDETILVTAMLDGAQIGDRQTITITDDDEPVSTDATLSSLVLNDGTNDLMLTPTFATDTTSYTASVANDIDQITVTPETTDDGASVEYLDASDATITDADGVTEGHQVDVSVGASEIKVTVTAADGTKKSYTVTLTRAAAATMLSEVSIDADATPTTITIGVAAFTLTRAAPTDEALSVAVRVTQEATFVSGSLPTTVQFAASESSKRLVLDLTGSATATGSLTVAVQEGTEYEVSALLGSATVEVLVYDPVLTFRVDAAAKSVGEGAGSVTATVIAETAADATAPEIRTLQVAVTTSNQTAKSGLDFEQVSATLSFAPEDFTLSGTAYRAERTLSVTILDDALVEPAVDGVEESFTIALVEGTPALPSRVTIPDTEQAPGEMVVTIEDNDEPNAVPVFTDGAATTRSVAENTAAGQNVGAAVAATDTDNDTLTYTLGGTDAASFDIVATSGQLLTKSGVTYDHEADSSYTLTVTASDGNGGSASIAVTVAVTDMNEEPTGKPVISGTGYVYMYEPLAVDTSGITDADGLSTPSFTYQWRSGHAGETTGGAIPGATGDGFTPGTAEFGKWLQVVVSYTDNAANRESVSSKPTAVVRTRSTDYTQPLRVSIGTTAPQPVGAWFTVRISFFIDLNGEPVSGFTLEDISVTNGTASELRRLDTFAYQATITPTTVGEPVTVQVAAGVAGYAGEETKTNEASPMFTMLTEVDEDPPEVSMYLNESEPRSPHQGPYAIGVRFSEPVRRLQLSDFTVTPATARLSNLSHAAAKASAGVTVRPPSKEYAGVITVTLNGGAVRDYGNNTNAATSLTRQIAADSQKPEVVEVVSSSFVPNERHLKLLSSEWVYALKAGKVKLQDAADLSDTIRAALSNQWSSNRALFEVSTGYRASYPQCLKLTVKAGAFQDWAGHTNEERVLYVKNGSGVSDCQPPGPEEPAAAEGVLAATVTVVSIAEADGDGIWTAGEAVVVTVAFSAAVTVDTDGGTPALGLRVGGAAREAAWADGSGTAELSFSYVVTAADGAVTAVLVAADSLALNGGTIRDEAGVDAELTHRGVGRAGAPVALSVADARATEGEEAGIGFLVTLNRAAAEPVTVAYATADGTARAGEDYTATSGTLSFAPGATERTVTVALLDDARDEGEETFTLRLSDAAGAVLDDAEATGTIENSDPLPRAWLARFGRTAAGHVLAAVGERLDGAAGSQMTIAGQRLSRAAAAAVAYDEEAFERGWDERLRAGRLRGEPPRSMELRALLASSSFDLAAYDEEAAAGARWTLWGRGAWTRFAGADGELTLSGDVFTGTVGADYRQDWLLAGLAVAYSTGAGTFKHSSGRGDLRTWLAGVHPYLRVALHERLAVWGVLGYGLLGHLELDEADAAAIETAAIETGVGVLMAAFGARGTLLAAPDTGGFELAAKADGLLLRMSSEAAAGLVATEADVERWRLLLEASYRALPLFGGVLTPSLEVGGRYDGGAAETGAGLVVGGSLRYALPAWGLTLTADGQGLLLHEAGGFSEWGAGGSLRFDPGAPDRGLALRVAPSWGRTTTGAARLWSLPDASRLAAYTPMASAGRLDAELSYGLDAPGGHGRLTPYAGLAHSAQGERAWRLGARLSLDPSFTLSLEGTRREHAGAPAPEHALILRGTLRR